MRTSTGCPPVTSTARLSDRLCAGSVLTSSVGWPLLANCARPPHSQSTASVSCVPLCTRKGESERWRMGPAAAYGQMYLAPSV